MRLPALVSMFVFFGSVFFIGYTLGFVNAAGKPRPVNASEAQCIELARSVSMNVKYLEAPSKDIINAYRTSIRVNCLRQESIK